MADLTEYPVSGETVFDGKLLHLRVDEARLPNGDLAIREYVKHPGGVGVLALTDDREILLVRQFRYPYAEETVEIPAGKRDPGESPLATGQRELREETGASARDWISLGTVYPSPGYTDEIIHLYLATGLSFAAASPDEDEFLTVSRLPLDDAVRLVMDGKFPDAKTQIAVLKAAERMKEGRV